MWRYLVGGLIGVVIGLIGGFMTMGAAVGAGAGAGIAVGLSAGICTTVKSAETLGLITAEQVDEVISNAATMFGAEVPEGTEIIGSAAQCDETLAQLRAAAQ